MASLADKAAALGATFSSALGSVGYFFNSFGQDLGSFLGNFSLGTFGAGGQLGGSGPFGSGAGVNPFFQLNMRDFSAGKNVIPNAEDFKNELGETLDIAPEDLKDISTETLLGLLQQVLPEEFATLMGGLTGATEADIQEWVNKSTENLIVDMLGLDGVPTYGDPNFLDYATEYYSFRNGTETERSVEYKDRRLTETVEQAFKDLGYNPSPEEIEELKKNPSGVAEYVDPRQVTNDEVIERLERLGVDVEGQAEAAGQTPEEYAEQIKQSIPPGDGSEAAFDDAMIMSLTSTAAGSTGSASFKEALSKMGTGVKNLLFGTNSGSPKPWLQILKEQIEKKYFPTFEDQMPGFPLEVVFEPGGASASNPTGALVRANLKIPVPFPINGPSIVIPLFSENGTYIGPTTPKGLLLDPETGIITQVKEGIEQTVGQIKGEVVQVLGAAGDVIRSFPLGLLENPDWKEGDPNPFELEVDENGDIAPQTDENGNPATGYAPDTGLPVYEEGEDPDAADADDTFDPEDQDGDGIPDSVDPEVTVVNEEDPVVSKSPYEDGSASDAFRNSSWPEDDIGTFLTNIETALDELGLDTDEIITILGRIETDLGNVTTTEELETFRTNLINELLDPDTGLPSMGIDADELEAALDPIATAIGTPDNPETEDVDETSGLYGYIDTAVKDLATVSDVERIVGVPDFIEGTDENGNPTRELTADSTGLYLEFFNAGIDYDTVIDLIGVPDNPETEDIDEGRGLFGYVGESNEDVKAYIGTLVGEDGVITEIQDDVNTLVGYVGVPPSVDAEGNVIPATGLHELLINNGVAIDALPGIIEGIVGVPEFGVDPETGEPTDEIVGGTGLYGEVVNLNTDVDTVITSINNTVIPQITAVAGFIGEPATVDEDGNVIPATGLHRIIEVYAGDSELRDDAITDAINKFTSDGKYTIEQVLTAIDTSNTDVKNFIGSPGADVDDPNTPEDETLPTGIYEGIAISEGRIIDAVSESEDNTDEYLTYISEIIGIATTDLTQENIDFVVGLIGEDEAITEINNDIRLYDVNFDGVINDLDVEILQGYVDVGVGGVGEIPAAGLYADAAQRQLELQGFISGQDDVTRGLITSEGEATRGFISDQDDVTRGLISSEGSATRGLMGATTLFNAMLGAGDISGTRVDVSTPDPARINYIYDFEDVFATPQQKSLFPSPYGKPQMAQRQSSTSGPLQIGGMAQGGKVDYDFTDEIMQIMRYGDN